jgi:hypothetical protein
MALQTLDTVFFCFAFKNKIKIQLKVSKKKFSPTKLYAAMLDR